ncbi:hypothetical protein AcdelDRAFT_0273 [Acidovorax delafieldii 2AN]|uniref:Apea-like HEPN domain-containing protein n=1 Tax=Acidovorax delafieldii 2AN TaxID=573060 RepID=C5T043_ACIDE|nr:hypothetical protein [Acidovorax delafieldii]EER62151.1 hypothetical protein AcdelDRAFT_0273 [Acidovorax delafieldii 2AN]
MKAKLLLPHGDYSGNLLWRKADLLGNEELLAESVKTMIALGYWASPFPEGDGVAFNDKAGGRSRQEVLADFAAAFPWLDVAMGESGDANLELAEFEVEEETEIVCTVIVPLERVFFEESFELGPFRFVCRREFDERPQDRLADWDGDYLQFDTELKYRDLLKVNRAIAYNDVVICKCLALAEHALDVIRFRFSAFDRPEFTPNPAGQLDDGSYVVEIVPHGRTHLKPLNLKGISRPMSASNNWLGPEIDDCDFRARELLVAMLGGRPDELALCVKAALRACHQSFYSLGDESRLLNLVFALDGLVHPKKPWTGWKHRTYVAALVSHGKVERFRSALVRYDELYTDIRNALVHKGKDFYELAQEPAPCCQDLYGFIIDVVELIADLRMTTVDELRGQATQWLATPAFRSCYEEEIQRICSLRQSPVSFPNW